MPSRILAVMITDIQGFTERTSATSRGDLRRLLDDHESLLMPAVRRFHGNLVKTIGDALLVTFESPTDAVLCGLVMQERLRGFNEGRLQPEQIRVRVAVSAGEVELRDNDVFGEAVNLAARIEAITEPGEIFFTEAVYLAMNKAEVPSSQVGDYRLKGLPEAVTVYRVIQDPNSERYQQLILKLREGASEDAALPSSGGKITLRPSARMRRRRTRIFVLLAVGVLAVGAVAWFKSRDPVADARRDIDSMLNEGDFAPALSAADRLYEQYPLRVKDTYPAVLAVVTAEIENLLNKGRPADAVDLLETRAKERPYLDLANLRMCALLAQAAEFAGKRNYFGASRIYYHLREKFPDDADVMREIVRCLGADYPSGATGLGITAAHELAKKTSGPLDDLTGRTLAAGLERENPEKETAAEMRAILLERFPAAIESVRRNLSSNNSGARVNAFLLLKAARRLSPEEELRCHFASLLKGDLREHRLSTAAAAEYALTEWGKSGWAERKKAAGIEKAVPGSVGAGALLDHRQALDALARAFFPEIEAAVLDSARTGGLFERWAAFKILETAGRLDAVDAREFHAKSLAQFDPQYIIAEPTEAALVYFSGQAGKERSSEARALIEAFRAKIAAALKEFEGKKANTSVERAQSSLARADRALGAFAAKQ
jgi:class 3 adenylate cyclase